MDTRDSSAPHAHRSTEEQGRKLRLASLEERLAHELMGDDERQELRDRVLHLRRRLDSETR